MSRVCVFETRFFEALISLVLLSTGSGLTTGKTIGFFTIGLRDTVHVDNLIYPQGLNYPQGLSTSTMRFLTGGGLLPSMSPVLSVVNRAAG